jgi:hypothetical protein
MIHPSANKSPKLKKKKKKKKKKNKGKKKERLMGEPSKNK